MNINKLNRVTRKLLEIFGQDINLHAVDDGEKIAIFDDGTRTWFHYDTDDLDKWLESSEDFTYQNLCDSLSAEEFPDSELKLTTFVICRLNDKFSSENEITSVEYLPTSVRLSSDHVCVHIPYYRLEYLYNSLSMGMKNHELDNKENANRLSEKFWDIMFEYDEMNSDLAC